jgi:hypothetical protein
MCPDLVSIPLPLFCADAKPTAPADQNRFSTELSPDFGENRDQYLVSCVVQVKFALKSIDPNKLPS